MPTISAPAKPSEVTVRGCSLSLGIKQVVQSNRNISEGWETNIAYSISNLVADNSYQPHLNKSE